MISAFSYENRKLALEEAKEHITGYCYMKYCYSEPLLLSEMELKRYSARDVVKGWRIFPKCMEYSMHDLDIFFDNEFPYSLAKTAITPATKFLKYPHIEEDGYLCLERINNYDNNVKRNINKVTISSLNLVYQCLEFKNQDDFQDEIKAYWQRDAESKYAPFWSLLDVTKKDSRIVKACKNNELIAENEDDLRQWLINAGKTNNELVDAFILWPKVNFKIPDDYPKNFDDVYNYIKENAGNDDILKSFETAVKSFESTIFIIIGFDVENGVVLIGIRISGKSNGKLHDGFRPGKMSFEAAVYRGYRGKEVYQKRAVARVDSKWILSRDTDEGINVLVDKKITIVGCGAIGSAVARLLVQAGVGHLNLIDSDHLEWVNIGRHTQGANSLINNEKMKKVDLLKKALNQDFPHLTIDAISKKWERIGKSKTNMLEKSDLVIMVTGSWEAESAMNDYAKSVENFPPILYGWTESFACAGHSVAIFKGEICLDCIFTKGKFRFNMARDFKKENFREPGCATDFNPFGNIELQPISSMIAEMSVDILSGKLSHSRLISWIGAKERVTEKGGKWTERAENLFKAYNDYGYFREVLDFIKIEHCASCSSKM